VSVGNQRVEIWGIPGKLLRMTIPDGGGSAAAAVMQHRVDLLTVEFNDNKGGKRSAVFFLPANEAEHALQNFALAPTLNRQVSDTNCQNSPIEPKSVLVPAPDWNNAEVPAAYRSLVYEHLIDRLQHTRDVEHVYTNVIGLLETTKAVLPHFRAQHSGVIVNISSIGGKVTFPLGTLYHGTKFAVGGISESLSYEMQAIGVKVKIVEPGAIKTDFATRSFAFSNDESLAEYQKTVEGLMAAVEPMMANGADALVVAEIIYKAATDGSDQLRYPAGSDAAPLLEKRRSEGTAHEHALPLLRGAGVSTQPPETHQSNAL
jgi:hypothetical protein